MSTVKRRRSERVQEARERKWNSAEQVIHNPWLWMEIAKWHPYAFLSLMDITRANLYPLPEVRLAQRQVFRSMLTVFRSEHGYEVKLRFDTFWELFNPFGPAVFCDDPGTPGRVADFWFHAPVRSLSFNSRLFQHSFMDGYWYNDYVLRVHKQELLQEDFERYRNDPFADFPGTYDLVKYD